MTNVEPPDTLVNRRRRVAVLGLLAVLLLAAGAVAGWVVAEQRGATADQAQAETAETRRVVSPTVRDVAAACLDQNTARGLAQVGISCPQAAAAEETIDNPGNETTAAVAVPPSPEQVEAAVAVYCANAACAGTDGTDGSDGRSPTPRQVAAAVATYCDARGQCQGADGQDGTTGAQGPPPSAEQVFAAVTVFCADGACQGPAGPAGPAGPEGTDGADGVDGANGRGLAELVCNTDTEQLEAVFTDGTRQAIENSDCVADTLLDP